MSNTKNTKSFSFRFSTFYDMDIIARLAMEENRNDYVTDALWYYIQHEDEARDEVEAHRKTIRKYPTRGTPITSKKEARQIRKKTLHYLFNLPTTSATKSSTSAFDQTTLTQ